ncbi:MAG TPA: serine/threonine-protein kinase, partial [Gemmataceae bacterium]
MTERDIFLTALEHEDLAGRAAYLDAACAGRPALRRRVEALLRCHHADAAFLAVPVMEQLADAEESLAFLSPPAEPGSLGRLDHYEVLEVVGRGGTGVVLKARDTKLQRVVAVKALAPRLAASAAARERFVREAQAAAAVRDDNVVAIYAVGDDGPVPYLVMEYIHGLTLDQRVRRDKALELKETLRIGMQVAAGLAAAHATGLIHRDIKPANILIEPGPHLHVKITDFGLARAADDASLTQSGMVAGTPLFMAPEQAQGESLDHRADLFSLGSVLYAMCAGRPPFRAPTTVAVLKRVCEDEPRDV